jgi:cullin 1
VDLFVHLFTYTDRHIYIVSLGLDDNDASKLNLEVYKNWFETPFVEATEVYYKTESEKFISENSVPDYMKKVCSRLVLPIKHP